MSRGQTQCPFARHVYSRIPYKRTGIMTIARLISFLSSRPAALAAAAAALMATTPAFAQTDAAAAAAVTDTASGVIGAPKEWGLGFQPSASPVKHEMVWFHNQLLLPMITVITVFVML